MVALTVFPLFIFQGDQKRNKQTSNKQKKHNLFLRLSPIAK